MGKRVALYHGTVSNDAFYFAPIVNGVRVQGIVLDTGAFELTFNDKVAKRLKLPNLGSIRIVQVAPFLGLRFVTASFFGRQPRFHTRNSQSFISKVSIQFFFCGERECRSGAE